MNLALAHETIARWQFGVTTVYHFLFVPLTISLSGLTAGLQTAWIRTGREKYFRATRFWGKLFLINLAMGVVTGIVQEFQFGMNWSRYSRFVGDVFGPPLAMEALVAFFLESTFIGLWIFGWDRLPRRLHCGCIWAVCVGTLFSGYFILAANSWMQHPVGYHVGANGRAQLNDIWRVLFQNTTLVQAFHTFTAAYLSGGAFMVGIAGYLIMRQRRRPEADRQPIQLGAARTSLRLGLVTLAVSGILVAISGDTLGKVMFEQQPMKMASAEALWETEAPAPFSVFAVGDVNKGHNTVEWQIPGLLSFLAHNNFHQAVPGIKDTAAKEAARYGGRPRDYYPMIPTTYWGFRWMIGFGMFSFLLGLAGLWLTRHRFWVAPEHRRGEDQVPELMLTRKTALNAFLTRWSWRIAACTLFFPLVGNSWGWIFTEMGRQPWVVFGVMRTARAESPNVTVGNQVFSLTVFTLLYAVLAVIEIGLLKKYAQAGIPEEEPPARDPRLRGPGPDGPGGPDGSGEDSDRPMAFAY